jgi:hypothetical protein
MREPPSTQFELSLDFLIDASVGRFKPRANVAMKESNQHATSESVFPIESPHSRLRQASRSQTNATAKVEIRIDDRCA